MPGEVVIPSSIIAFVLIAVIVVGVYLNVNYTLMTYKAVKELLNAETRASNVRLLILNGFAVNDRELILNVTSLGGSIAPLTETQVIVSYVNLEGVEVTAILNYRPYEAGAGWFLNPPQSIHVGSTTRSVEGMNYLMPGEIAELVVVLPTDKLSNTSVKVTVVAPNGSRSSMVVSDA